MSSLMWLMIYLLLLSLLMDGSVSREWTMTLISNATPSVVTTSVGQTVYLECQIANLEDRKVAWIRKRDLAILSVDHDLVVADNRFVVVHAATQNVWLLRISDVDMEDDGEYECHLGLRRHNDQEAVVRSVTLRVKDSHALIVGSPSSFVRVGSAMRLECIVHQASSMPSHVFWYHNNFVMTTDHHLRLIQHAAPRPEMGDSERLEKLLVSTVVIDQVQENDAGIYTCAPSNARHAATFVHVQKGPQWAMNQGRGEVTGTQLMSSSSPPSTLRDGLQVLFLITLSTESLCRLL